MYNSAMWIWIVLLLIAYVPARAADCESLARLVLPHASISRAELVPAGTFTPPYGQPIANMPAFCRVAVTSKPTPDSHIEIELWLPQSAWNGRFEGTGNGGFAGRISYGALASGVRAGYAVANTDMGMATPSGRDASAFIGRPDIWADWGYRSTHEMTALSKQIVASFYGKAPQRSYFTGCSTGGEQALMEAQRFPADYDGIVAGAPANNRTGVHLNILWNFVTAQRAPIPKSKLAMLGQASVQACHGIDGVIADPSKCHFDPAILQCTGADADSCLTAAQVETARQLYQGPVNPRTHAQLYPGLTPGSEFGWDQLAPNPEPPFAPIFKWVFGADWNWRSFDFDRAANTYENKLAPTLNATDPKLDEFRKLGHKLVVYHGWADWLVAPGESLNYRRNVAAANPDLDSFYRLFMIPGMAHCSGGPGEDRIDLLTAAIDWVEHGNAPAKLVASKAKPATSTRLICPYPQTAKYRGAGDLRDAANYSCSAE